MKTIVHAANAQVKFPRLVVYDCGCYVVQKTNRQTDPIRRNEFCGFVIHKNGCCCHNHSLGYYSEVWGDDYKIFNGSITIEND
jgi:hypothetical protein